VRQVYTGKREAEGVSFFKDVEEEWPERSEREEWIEDELFKLRSDLVDMLHAGFQNHSQRKKNKWWNPEEFESLWFGVAGSRTAAKTSRMTAAERRDYFGSGAYVLLVDGALRDLVRFLVGLVTPKVPELWISLTPQQRFWIKPSKRASNDLVLPLARPTALPLESDVFESKPGAAGWFE